MKQFKDLVFGPHPHDADGKAAKYFFENGYGVSVVRFWGLFGGSYTRGNQWELAVLTGKPDDWEICYDSPITDDVIGHLTETEVTEIMRKVQLLPSKQLKIAE